jgi:hypothetical protein
MLHIKFCSELVRMRLVLFLHASVQKHGSKKPHKVCQHLMSVTVSVVMTLGWNLLFPLP